MPPLYLNNRIYFVTFRLDDSLPQHKINEMKQIYALAIASIETVDKTERQNKINEIAIEIFGKYEYQLDDKPYGNCYLEEKEIATIIYEKVLSMNQVEFDLKCFCIMPNHVHLLFGSLGITAENMTDPVDKWLKNIKGSTSRKINLYLGKKGTLWNDENWDRFIRNEEHYSNTYYYIVNNPTKAGLSEKYSKPSYMWRKDMNV